LDAPRSLYAAETARRRSGRTRVRFAAALAALVVLASASSALAAEGPWSQFQGAATHAGVGDGPAPPYREAWTAEVPLGGPTGRYGASAPIVAGDLVVAVAPDEVLAFELATGRSAWEAARDTGPSVPAAVASLRGGDVVVFTEGFGDNPPTASPTPTPGSPSTETGSGDAEGPFDSHVDAVDLATGKPAWDRPLRLEEVSRTGVTVVGDTAYVGTNAGQVVAVDAASGEARWTAELDGYVGRAIAATPDVVVVTVQGSVDARTGPTVVALDPANGEERWTYDPELPPSFVSAVSLGGDSAFVGFQDQTLRSLALTDGTERWAVRLATPLNPWAAPSVAGDLVVAADLGGMVTAIDASTGAVRSEFATNEGVGRSSAVVVGTTALVPTVEGSVQAIDLDAGERIWRSPQGSALRDLALAPDLLVGVRAGEGNGLVAFEPDPDGTLVRDVSPTVLALGPLFLNYLLVAVLLGGVLVLALRPVARRRFPAVDALPPPAADTDDGSQET
jgi:outer membrane protein assembly factor BamB